MDILDIGIAVNTANREPEESGQTGVGLPVLKGVLNFGVMDALFDPTIIEVPADIATELSAEPYAFMVRCATEANGGAVLCSTAIFMPFNMADAMTGWCATVFFAGSNNICSVLISQIDGQFMCQVEAIL